MQSGAQFGRVRGDCRKSAGPAAVDTDETGLILRVLAGDNFFFGLRVGHPRLDALKNLLFRQAGVLEAPNLRAIERSQPLHAPVKNRLHRGVRETHELQGYRVGAEVIELVGAGDVEDLDFVDASLREASGGVRADKGVLMRVGRAKESNTSFVADARLLELHKLRHFLIGSVQPLELLDVAEIHPGLIERAIIRQEVLIAPTRKKGADAEEHKMCAAVHDFIVAGAKGLSGKCALGDTRRKDRCEKGLKDRAREKARSGKRGRRRKCRKFCGYW